MIDPSLPWRYLKAVYHILEERNGILLAQAVGFKVLITIIPLAVFSTGILGRVLHNDRISQTVIGVVDGLIPGYLGEITGFLEQLQASSGTFTWVGALGLVVSMWMILTSLESIVSTFIMGNDRMRRPLWGRQVVLFQILLQAGLAFLLTFALTLGVQGLNSWGLEFLQFVGLDNLWVETGWRRTINLLGILVPYGLTLWMFFQLYFFVPLPHPPWRSSLIGTLVAASLWEFAKSLFTFYATRVGTFERYRSGGGETGVAVLGDAFGLLLAIVVWAYYTGIVLIVGAITVRLHEKHGWGRAHTSPSADPAS